MCIHQYTRKTLESHQVECKWLTSKILKQIKKSFLLQLFFFSKKILGFGYAGINVLTIRHEKREVFICPDLGVSQLILLIFFVVAVIFITISGKLILICFHFTFVTVVHVQLIPSSVHSYNEEIIVP